MPRISHIIGRPASGPRAQNEPPVIPELERNHNKDLHHIPSTTYQPFSSKKTFISALSSLKCNNLEKNDVCPICLDDLHSTAEEQCAGPPIRMPCCNKPFGQACISVLLAHDIEHCPNCKRRFFTYSEWRSRYGHRRPAWWLNYLLVVLWLITFCVLVAIAKSHRGPSCQRVGNGEQL